MACHLKILSLLFTFVIPWQENSKTNPEQALRNSFRCINKDFCDKLKGEKRKHMLDGIEEGHKEILNESPTDGPFSYFLALIGPKKGSTLFMDCFVDCI